MTLVNLYEYIKQYALTIPIVKSYYNTSVYECWNNQEVKYGSVVFAVKSVREQNSIAKFDCVLYYGDRLNENKSNRDSIQSDAIGVINNIVNRLNCSNNIEYVTYPVQSTIFEQKFADELAGAYANLTIDLQSTGDCCDYNLLADYYTKGEVDEKIDGIVAGEIDMSDYYTKAQIDKKLDDIEIGDIDLTNYYTKQQIDNKGYLTSIPSQYVTESELEAKKYLTAIPSQYVTESELEAKKYLTSIPSEYVTETELEQRLETVDVDLTGYATEQWVEGKGYLNTAEVDRKIQDAVLKDVNLSDYYTKQQIDNKGFITSIPSEYVTESELESKGYLTTIPTEYVTESELEQRLDGIEVNVDLDDYYTKQQIDGKGYVTNAELVTKDYASKEYVREEVSKVDLSDYYTKGQSDSKYQPKGNYLTSIPAEYVTESELESKGYLTSVPSQYVTENELESKGYLTSIPSQYVTETELNGKNYATKTELSGKQNQLVSGSNIKTINGQSILGSGDIEIQGGSGGSVDLDGYATEQWVEEQGYLTSIPSQYVTETELETRLENVEVDLTNYYTKEQVDALVGAVNQVLNSLINDIDTEALELQLNDILNKA